MKKYLIIAFVFSAVFFTSSIAGASDCAPGDVYNSSNGHLCSTSSIPGCQPGFNYSPINGQKCDSSTSGSTGQGVGGATVDLTASKTAVKVGETVLLKWTSSGLGNGSCSIKNQLGNSIGNSFLGTSNSTGITTPVLTLGMHTFYITCDSSISGYATDSVAVNVTTEGTTPPAQNPTENPLPPVNPPAAQLKIGGTVMVKGGVRLNVRRTPSTTGTRLGIKNGGSGGVIIDGPRVVGGITWLKIDYTSGADGWSAASYLELVSSGTSGTGNSSGNTGTTWPPAATFPPGMVGATVHCPAVPSPSSPCQYESDIKMTMSVQSPSTATWTPPTQTGANLSPEWTYVINYPTSATNAVINVTTDVDGRCYTWNSITQIFGTRTSPGRTHQFTVPTNSASTQIQCIRESHIENDGSFSRVFVRFVSATVASTPPNGGATVALTPDGCRADLNGRHFANCKEFWIYINVDYRNACSGSQLPARVSIPGHGSATAGYSGYPTFGFPFSCTITDGFPTAIPTGSRDLYGGTGGGLTEAVTSGADYYKDLVAALLFSSGGNYSIDAVWARKALTSQTGSAVSVAPSTNADTIRQCSGTMYGNGVGRPTASTITFNEVGLSGDTCTYDCGLMNDGFGSTSMCVGPFAKDPNCPVAQPVYSLSGGLISGSVRGGITGTTWLPEGGVTTTPTYDMSAQYKPTAGMQCQDNYTVGWEWEDWRVAGANSARYGGYTWTNKNTGVVIKSSIVCQEGQVAPGPRYINCRPRQ